MFQTEFVGGDMFQAKIKQKRLFVLFTSWKSQNIVLTYVSAGVFNGNLSVL